MSKKKPTARKSIDPRLELVHRVIVEAHDAGDASGEAVIRQLLNAPAWGCFSEDAVKKVFTILFEDAKGDSDQSCTLDPIFDAAKSEHEMTCACCRAMAVAS